MWGIFGVLFVSILWVHYQCMLNRKTISNLHKILEDNGIKPRRKLRGLSWKEAWTGDME
jgi:hypothetical protein